ncbi:VOC family protein [Allokutzneria sp. NRRL B-24872]|uniref:VOC family protein n=1 Tax=Allokutzneria sp. NRRL B-24872 TaxID=1137961 RepID=UPI000A3C77AA|nr:VOC family protein [Allokutzneria sp. NRRL B-24872]
MEILSSRVLLRPRDPERSRAFYRDVLGLAVFREFPGGTVFFLGQGLLEVAAHSGDGSAPGSTSLYMQVRDVRAEFEVLVSRGAEVLREPEVEPWGLHEGWIRDPDGVRIVLVEIPADHPLRRDTRS